MNILSYLFWPRPDQIGYESPKLFAMLIISIVLIILAFAIKYWRRSLKNPQTKKLSKSWTSIAAWFGSIGVVLVVSRAEDISYISMRIWWVFWWAIFLFIIFLQVRLFKARYYSTVSSKHESDPRQKYLPKKKR